jgi:tRNA threonylcarbamoyladenosine biosynthesis protein TsaB
MRAGMNEQRRTAPHRTMNILAIETSSELCSAALLLEGTLIEREREAGQTHSSLILPMVTELLREAGIGFDAITGVAFGEGPGSFTGLRIACGVAQGLAEGAQVKVAGICTLEALAEDAWQLDSQANRQVVACLDARMGEVYHAAYRREGDGWRACSEPGLYAPGAIPIMEGTWTGAGSAFAVHAASLRARQPFTAELPALRPHARTVAVLARARFAAGHAVDPERALPLYLRDKVAQTLNERRA